MTEKPNKLVWNMHKPEFFKKKKTIILAFSAYLFVAVLGLVLLVNTQQEKIALNQLSGQAYTDKVEEYKTILSEAGARSSLTVFKSEIEQDSLVANVCHPIAHSIGQAAYDYYGSVVEAFSQQDSVCNSGYTHGVLESYFNSLNDITSDVGQVCKDSKTGYESWQCYHGLGHGFMYFTNNDLPQSLRYCESLEGNSVACVNGVLMENFGGDGGIHVSTFVSDEGPNSPCSELQESQKGDCYLYAPTYYLGKQPGDYKGAVAWCKQAPEDYYAACLSGIGSQLYKENIREPRVLLDFCAKLDSTEQRSCVNGAISFSLYFFGSYDESYQRCSDFGDFTQECETFMTEKKKIFELVEYE